MIKNSRLLTVLALIMVFAFVFTAGSFAQEYNIAVIIKATDSGFWQDVLTGAKAADEKLDNVTITTHGPTSESQIAEQVAILENVITRQPDAIVMASTSSDASVPALERAYDQGIKIITIDNKVNTDKVHSHLATDNIVGGKLAAEMFVQMAEEHGKSVESGKVGLISAMAGVQVLADRDEGFITGLNEYAPGLEILETRYVDNRIPEALSTAEDILTSHPEELVGFFADNNHTGAGVARAIAERGIADEIPVVAFDADDAEKRALEEGTIDALIVQDPFRMGYDGVHYAVRAIEGEELPAYVDTGVTAVTRDNMNDEEIQNLLNPEQRAEAVLAE
jgi:ribose transport system substrate-binding protein